MFGFFTRRRHNSAAGKPRRARPTLEALEDRWCPTVPGVTLTATELMGNMVRLTGTVTDDNPSLATVSFSGAASGSAMVDPSGNFTLITMANTLGAINAVVHDREGLSSNPAQVNLTNVAPTITLSVIYNSQKSITLTGKVTDENPMGMTVTISGAAAGTTTVMMADGSFTITLNATQLGNVQATTTDVWGMTSNTAQVVVANEAPVITNFEGVREAGNIWTFSGKVIDESAPGLTVRLGGLPSLQTKFAMVESSGWFSCTVILGPSEDGTASAQTTDWWGLESEEALFLVRY